METSEHSLNGHCAILFFFFFTVLFLLSLFSTELTSADPGDQLAEIQVPLLLLKSHLPVKCLFPCLPWALVFPVK